MIGGSRRSLLKVANMDCEFILDILVVRSPLSAWSLPSSSMYLEQLKKLIFAASLSFSDTFCILGTESDPDSAAAVVFESGPEAGSGLADTFLLRKIGYMLHKLLICDG